MRLLRRRASLRRRRAGGAAGAAATKRMLKKAEVQEADPERADRAAARPCHTAGSACAWAADCAVILRADLTSRTGTDLYEGVRLRTS